MRGSQRAGISPQMSWGANVFGASDAELERMRRIAARVVTAAATGSKGVQLQLAGGKAESVDPAFQVTLAPLRSWAQAVQLAGEAGQVSLRLMERALKLAVPAPRAQIAGPARGLLVAMRRLGWTAVSVDRWLTDGRVLLDLSASPLPVAAGPGGVR